jgi:hypothetical protein
MPDSKQAARKPTSGRNMTVIAVLLAVIVVVAAWLSNCIPGFGLGSSGRGDDTDVDAGKAGPAKPEPAKPEEPAKAEPPKPEPAKPEPPKPEPLGAEPPKPADKTLSVTIDVGGCSVAGSERVECSKLCERTELFEGIDDAVLDVAGASHGSVVEMVDCLKAKGIDKVAIRRESP